MLRFFKKGIFLAFGKKLMFLFLFRNLAWPATKMGGIELGLAEIVWDEIDTHRIHIPYMDPIGYETFYTVFTILRNTSPNENF